VESQESLLPQLETIVFIRNESLPTDQFQMSYKDFISRGLEVPEQALNEVKTSVRVNDVCNLQYTSGTTAAPKAAMLTHQ